MSTAPESLSNDGRPGDVRRPSGAEEGEAACRGRCGGGSASPTSKENILIGRRESCAVCGGAALEAVLELPALPLTDTFCRPPGPGPLPGFDQRLLLCRGCGHGQLGERLNPAVLYGEAYHFRTSASATARRGTALFLSRLEALAPGRIFRRALDVGCNDLHLLKQLRGRAESRVGIDPLWTTGERDPSDPDIQVIGAAVEEVDLEGCLEGPPDLVVSRHTLEHLDDPRAVLGKLVQAAAGDALFLFETPGFTQLVNRSRFDQVFHQHLQYFTLSSFERLLAEVGAERVSGWESYHDWGAMTIAFRKAQGRPAAAPLAEPGHSASSIRESHQLFLAQMSAARSALRWLRGTTLHGYGAAQMLPVLAYHLQDDLSSLTSVLDDDPEKDGLGYRNLPVVIRRPETAGSLQSASVLLTAVDNVKPILEKLLRDRPRHLIVPLNLL